MVAGVRPETPSALITAVSVSGSVPTTLALAEEPSLKKTVIVPPSPAIAATWLLVRISPSELRMMPDPEPAPWLPLTSILTTDGSTFAATCSTEPSAAGESGVSTTWEVLWSLGLAVPPEPSSSYAFQAAAPPTPAAPPTTRAVATTAAARPARRGRFWTGRVAVCGGAVRRGRRALRAAGPAGRVREVRVLRTLRRSGRLVGHVPIVLGQPVINLRRRWRARRSVRGPRSPASSS